jgi:hypothetical protein
MSMQAKGQAGKNKLCWPVNIIAKKGVLIIIKRERFEKRSYCIHNLAKRINYDGMLNILEKMQRKSFKK